MFMEIDIRCDQQNRTLDLLEETGQDISPGPRSEPLEIGLPRFPGESHGQLRRSALSDDRYCHYIRVSRSR